MHNNKQSMLSVLKYVSLLLGCFVALMPITVALFASFKSTEEYRATGPLTPPMNWLNFDNFTRAFVEGNMLTGFANTAFIVLVSLTGATLFGTMVAYVLARFKFAGKKWLLGAFLIATLIPGVTTQVTTFQIVNGLGLFNSIWAAIILYMGTDIIGIYIFIQFMDTISEQLDESAMIDGASYLTIYTKIILPLLKPAIVTTVIIKGVGLYNDFYIPFLYMPARELQVLSTALFAFKGPYGSQWEIICAAIMIVIVPTVIVFVSLQKFIYNGFTQGSVK